MRLIDADVLIEIFEDRLEKIRNRYGDYSGEAGTCAGALHLIRVQPTIEPEPHWISCSERLPKESGQYLITVKYKPVDGYEDIYAEHGEWDGEKWDMFCFGHCGEVENIIAWMPLPEAYREESKHETD